MPKTFMPKISLQRLVLIVTALIAAPLTITPMAFARGSAEAGAAKAAVCSACHPANGALLNPDWPVLAGQNALYIEKQLHMFHKSMRVDASNSMPAMVVALSDQDIEDLAAYYATLTPAGLEAEAGSFEVGRKLFLGGDRKRGIPACAACHGPTGAGNPGSGYPALRAQSAAYTGKQLDNYLSKARYTMNARGDNNGGDNAMIMQSIAGRLTADDIKSLAAYAQGLR